MRRLTRVALLFAGAAGNVVSEDPDQWDENRVIKQLPAAPPRSEGV